MAVVADAIQTTEGRSAGRVGAARARREARTQPEGPPPVPGRHSLVILIPSGAGVLVLRRHVFVLVRTSSVSKEALEKRAVSDDGLAEILGRCLAADRLRVDR